LADELDILQLTTEMGSALKVVEARKIDGPAFCEIIRTN